MTINPAFLAPCGLYCGVCAIHMAGRDNNEKFKERLVWLYQGKAGKGTLPGSETLTPEDIHCQGCLSDDRFVYCQQCEIRDCVKKKGITGCHQCQDFPCALVGNVSMEVGRKVIQRAVPYRREHGDQKWVMDEEARYHCPSCGQKVFRGAARCNKCKTEFDLD